MTETDSAIELRGWTFAQIPNALIQDRQLSHAAFRLFCVIATYANKEKRAWPGQARLAADMGVKPRQIRNLLDELRVRGWLEIERRGKTLTNVYVLNALPAFPGPVNGSGWNGEALSHYTNDRQNIAGHSPETRAERQRITAHAQGDRQEIAGVSGKELPPNDIQKNDSQIQSENDSQQQRARAGLDVAAADLEKMTPKVQAGYWLRLAGVAGSPALELAQRLNPVDALAWALEAERWRAEGVAENPPGLLVTCARTGERPPLAQRAYAGWLLEDAGALTGLALAEIAGGALRDTWARSRYVTGEYADYVEG